jgi:chemotaxis protein CheD
MKYLEIGRIIVSRDGERVWTVLGPCIAMVMRHAPSGWGAICHAQLPEKGDNYPADDNALRFVAGCYAYMTAFFAEKGILPTELEVGLYGGAELFSKQNPSHPVGPRNIETARRLIAAGGLRLVDCQTGGTQARKVIFNPDTGRVETSLLENTLIKPDSGR